MKQQDGPRRSWLDRLPPDIFGSDVFVDYQGTYVWQANQVGHVFIGFAATSLLTWAAAALFGATVWPAALWIAIAIVALYGVKEWIDLKIAEHQAQGLFAYDTRELWEDMAADAGFVALGAATAAAAFYAPDLGLAAGLAAVAAFLVVRRRFLPAKASLDRACLPYVFRLANFPRTDGVHAHNARRIEAFLAGRPVAGFSPPPAVLIQGYRGTGKSTLGVGIASEAAVGIDPATGACGRALYFTAFQLLEPPAPGDLGDAEVILRRKPRALGSGDAWSAREADVLVIDDVDSDNPLVLGDTPERLLETLETRRRDILDLVRSKRTVWITGSSRFAFEDDPHGWRAWLGTLCRLYGLTPDPDRAGDDPAAIEAREPIPVIWLRQPLRSVSA